MSTAATAMTPPEIDALLDDLGQRRAKLVARADGLRAAAHQARTARHPNVSHALDLEARSAEYTPRIAALTDQMTPYEQEFDRRGGWTRAFLVQNAGGHVHSSLGCSSCYATTRYTWLTAYSGKDEERIVDAAAELACTTCYPSAPVDVLTRVGEIRRPSDLEREHRATEKAAKDARSAAAAVIDANTGKKLYSTERAASNAIATALQDLHWYGHDHPSAIEWQRTVERAVAALAAKQGSSPEATMADHQHKADKKFATTARKALRELKRQRGDVVVDDLVPGLQDWVEHHGIPA